MVTLKELFDLMWDITCVNITARSENMNLLHNFIFSDKYEPSIHEWHDIEAGKLSVVIGKINAHGDPTRGGSETGWGYKEKSIPKEIMEARITHMVPMSRYNGEGSKLYLDVELPLMTVEILKQYLSDKALKWEDRDE